MVSTPVIFPVNFFLLYKYKIPYELWGKIILARFYLNIEKRKRNLFNVKGIGFTALE